MENLVGQIKLAQLAEGAGGWYKLVDLSSYEAEGQVLWQGYPDQGADPDCHTALAATLGLRNNQLLAQLLLLDRRQK